MKFCISFILGFNFIYGQTLPNAPKPNFKFLTGTVVDSSTSLPLEFASISLKSTKTKKTYKGSISDKKGHFSIKYEKIYPSNVVVDFIGFHKKTILDIPLTDSLGHATDVKLDTIFLVQKTIQFDEISAMGKRVPLKITANKNTFYISKSLSISNQSAHAALRRIPNVDVSMDGIITINGDPNIKVFVNGLSSSAFHDDKKSRLNSFPVFFIDHIDVITNPSVEFDPDGMGGIINIITKENWSDGFHASSSVSVGSMGRVNGNLNMNFKKGRMNNILMVSGKSDYESDTSLRNYIWDYGNFELNSVQEKRTFLKPLNGNVNLNTKFEFNKDHSFNLNSGLTFFNHDSKDTILHYSPVQYQMTSIENNRGWTLDLSGNHKLKVEKKGNWETRASFSQSGEHQKDINDRNANGSGPDNHSHIYRDNSIQSMTLNSKVFIMKPSFFENCQFGLSTRKNMFESELDYLHLPFGFQNDESVHSIFINTSRFRLKTLYVSVGAKVESVSSNSRIYKIELPTGHAHQDTSNVFMTLIDSSMSESPFSNDYTQVYPNISTGLSHGFGEKSVSLNLSYSKRVNRPTKTSINPFPSSMIDEYHVRTGNPFLRPEFVDIYRARVGYRKSKSNIMSFSTTFFYKNIKDLIQWNDISIVSIGDQSFEIMRAGNVGNGFSYGKEFFILFNPKNKFYSSLGYQDWITETDTLFESDLSGNSKGSSLSGVLSFDIYQDWDVEIYGKFYGKSEIPTGEIEPYGYVDFVMKKSFIAKNLFLSFSIFDMFNSRTLDIYTEQSISNPTSNVTYIQRLTASRQQDQRLFSLGIQYFFGSPSDLIHQSKAINSPTRPDDIDIDY